MYCESCRSKWQSPHARSHWYVPIESQWVVWSLNRLNRFSRSCLINLSSGINIVIYVAVFLMQKIFLFCLLPLGVATADSRSPFCSFLCVFILHFHCCHVLSYRIHKPPLFRSSPFALFWQLHRQHLSLNIPSIFPSTCPNHLSLASYFLSKPSRLRCPSGVLLPDHVHSRHS